MLEVLMPLRVNAFAHATESVDIWDTTGDGARTDVAPSIWLCDLQSRLCPGGYPAAGCGFGVCINSLAVRPDSPGEDRFVLCGVSFDLRPGQTFSPAEPLGRRRLGPVTTGPR